MNFPANKKAICITGNVWTGSKKAPRRMLIKEGFVRPTWFTTRRPITDGEYKRISETEYHMALADNELLAHTEYGSGHVGIREDDFLAAANDARTGVLVVGPQEMAGQIAAKVSQTVVVTFKDESMETAAELDEARRAGQLHRIDIDILKLNAWDEAYAHILEAMGLSE